MIFWTKIRDKMIFWRFPKSVSVLYNNGLVFLHPDKAAARHVVDVLELLKLSARGP